MSVFIPDPFRLKSFSSASKGDKATITIVCETTDLVELGWALRYLSDQIKKQKAEDAAAVSAARKAEKTKPLALPPPQLALAAPLRALSCANSEVRR